MAILFMLYAIFYKVINFFKQNRSFKEIQYNFLKDEFRKYQLHNEELFFEKSGNIPFSVLGKSADFYEFLFL